MFQSDVSVFAKICYLNSWINFNQKPINVNFIESVSLLFDYRQCSKFCQRTIRKKRTKDQGSRWEAVLSKSKVADDSANLQIAMSLVLKPKANLDKFIA